MRARRVVRGSVGLAALVGLLGAGVGLVAVAGLQGAGIAVLSRGGRLGASLRAPGVVLALGLELVIAALAIGALAGRGGRLDDEEEDAHGLAGG